MHISIVIYTMYDVHIQTRMSVCKHHYVCVLYMCKLNDLVYTGRKKKKKRYFDILPLIHFVRLIMNLTEDNKHLKVMDLYWNVFVFLFMPA